MAQDLDNIVVKRPPPRPNKGMTIEVFSSTESKSIGINQSLVDLPEIVVKALTLSVDKPAKVKTAEEWTAILDAFRTRSDVSLIKKVLRVGLTKGQRLAFNAFTTMLWSVRNGEPGVHRIHGLQGWAGTGKSFTLRRVILFCDVLGIPWLLTAPTNKATKVLTSMVPGIKKDMCKTIYSALKLTMMAEEDQQVLVDTVQSDYASLGLLSGQLICVDESSMLNKQVTAKIKEVAEDLKLCIILIGDKYQLRPVGEEKSYAWDLCVDSSSGDAYLSKLTEVKRFDNALLDLSVVLRMGVRTGKLPPYAEVFTQHDGQIEVKRSQGDFDLSLMALKDPKDFTDRRVLAWRNKTTDRYNALIRKNLGFNDEFNVGDLLMLAQPKLQKVNYYRSIIVANIDEEVVVQAVVKKTMQPTSVYFQNLPKIEYWQLTTQTLDYQDKPTQLVLNQPLADDHGLEDTLQQMAAAAKRAGQMMYTDRTNSRKHNEERKQRWREYWTLREEFTLVRFAYAMTVHRSQGSSISETLVDARDIKCNSETLEQYQCLLVACTRARTMLTVLV